MYGTVPRYPKRGEVIGCFLMTEVIGCVLMTGDWKSLHVFFFYISHQKFCWLKNDKGVRHPSKPPTTDTPPPPHTHTHIHTHTHTHNSLKKYRIFSIILLVLCDFNNFNKAELIKITAGREDAKDANCPLKMIITYVPHIHSALYVYQLKMMVIYRTQGCLTDARADNKWPTSTIYWLRGIKFETFAIVILNDYPRSQSSWGQHGAHLGSVGPRWAPCWPHEPCYQGTTHLCVVYLFRIHVLY